MKLGLYSITYLGVWYNGTALTIEEVIDRARKFGYDGVEIDGKRPHGDPLDLPKHVCRDIRRYAEAQGIGIYAVAANNDFSSPIPEHREAQLVYLRELIRMTADLGVSLVRVFLAWPGVTLLPQGGARYDIAKRIWADTHRDSQISSSGIRCRDGLAEAARFAGDHGVTLALQNHRPVIHSYRDVQRMMQEIGAPNLKACFDTRLEHEMTPKISSAPPANSAIGRSSRTTATNTLRSKARSFQRREKMPAQVQGLAEIGYQGYLGFELCHPLPCPGGKLAGIEFADENARLAARYARGLIATTMST